MVANANLGSSTTAALKGVWAAAAPPGAAGPSVCETYDAPAHTICTRSHVAALGSHPVSTGVP